MSFQTGIIKLRGTIGEVTFYYSKGKHLSRRRTSLNKERIMNDPAFERTRQYLPVFGAASKMASAIHRQLSAAQKRKVRNSRLIKEILPLIKEKWSAKRILRHMKERYGIALKGFKTLRSFVINVRTASSYPLPCPVSRNTLNHTTVHVGRPGFTQQPPDHHPLKSEIATVPCLQQTGKAKIRSGRTQQILGNLVN